MAAYRKEGRHQGVKLWIGIGAWIGIDGKAYPGSAALSLQLPDPGFVAEEQLLDVDRLELRWQIGTKGLVLRSLIDEHILHPS